MNKNTKRSAILILITTLFVISTVILRSIAAIKDLEDNLIYYGESGLSTAASVVMVVGAILLLALSFTLKKEDLRARFTSSLAYIPTGIVAAVLLLFAAAMFSKHLELNELSAMMPAASTAAALALVVSLCAALSSVHFILNAFIPERHAKVRAYFAIATLLLMAVYAAFLYFNMNEPINSTNKLVEQMAYLFTALFLLFETRISLGREMWRAYMAFGSVAALLTASAGIPSIIFYLAKGAPLTYTVESSVLLTVLFVFIFLKLCLAAISLKDEESPEMAVLREYAQRRQDALDNKAIEDGTQISIDELIDIPATEDADETIDETIEAEDDTLPAREEQTDETTNIEWTEDQ